MIKEPRLRFTEEERADPALEKPIRKADKAAAKADKAQAKIPKKQAKRTEVDPKTGKVTTKLVLEDKPRPPSKLSHSLRDAPGNAVAGRIHQEIQETEDDNVGVESAHKSEEAVETGVHLVQEGYRNHKLKPYRYVTEATFDAYLWQTVENKQKFISQIMTSKSPVRSCEDMDETALSYAEIKALCAGDPRIKEKMDLDVDVARLKLMRADHLSKQFRLEDQLLKVFPQEVERDTHLIAGFEKDIATLNAHPLPQEDFVGMTVGDVLITDKEEAGKAILTACKEAARGTAVEFGSYRGLNMRVQYDSFVNRFLLTLHGAVSHPMEVGNDARGNITRLDNAIAQIPKRLAATEEHLATVRQQIEAAKAEVSKPFPQEAELKTKSARLAELDAALNMDHTSSGRQADQPHREEER